LGLWPASRGRKREGRASDAKYGGGAAVATAWHVNTHSGWIRENGAPVGMSRWGEGRCVEGGVARRAAGTRAAGKGWVEEASAQGATPATTAGGGKAGAPAKKEPRRRTRDVKEYGQRNTKTKTRRNEKTNEETVTG
jgi:hypothetical protein